MGLSPAGKKSPEKQPDSADMGFPWKDSSWEDRKLNLVNVSLFCTPHLYGFKSFLGLPGRIFASKRKSEQLSSQTISECLFPLLNQVTHF